MQKLSPNSPQKTFATAFLVLIVSFSFFWNVSANQNTEITEKAVVDLVNQERKTEGLNILVENDKLTLSAVQKAEDMIKEDYFAHNSPSGKTPWFWMEKNNYDYRYAGENLAMDFDNALDQHSAWMKSPTHRKNILNQDFQEIGVAVKQGIIQGHLATITVQEFGTPRSFIPNHSSQSASLPQVQALEKQTDVNFKTLPVIDKNQLNSLLLKEKILLADWHSLAFLYLNTLILLIISIINPLIVAFLIVQFINFKAENEKELVLKD